MSYVKWLNIYKDPYGYIYPGAILYITRELADMYQGKYRISCIEIRLDKIWKEP